MTGVPEPPLRNLGHETVPERNVLTLTVIRVLILLDAAGFPLLACLLRNGEMRRVYLSGKLFVFSHEE
jgi:hypothetical protein